jgi:hypothetical protein
MEQYNFKATPFVAEVLTEIHDKARAAGEAAREAGNDPLPVYDAVWQAAREAARATQTVQA